MSCNADVASRLTEIGNILGEIKLLLQIMIDRSAQKYYASDSGLTEEPPGTADDPKSRSLRKMRDQLGLGK